MRFLLCCRPRLQPAFLIRQRLLFSSASNATDKNFMSLKKKRELDRKYDELMRAMSKKRENWVYDKDEFPGVYRIKLEAMHAYQREQFLEAKEILTSAKESRVKFDADLWNLWIMSHFHIAENFNSELDLEVVYDDLMEMVYEGVKPSHEAYDAALSAALEDSAHDTHGLIYGCMLFDGYAPTQFALSTIMHSTLDQELTDQCLKFLDTAYEMYGDELNDENIFANGIDAFVRKGRFDKALKLFHKFKSDGNVITNSHIYFSLIIGCQQISDPNEALKKATELFEELKAMPGLEHPDPDLYDIYLVVCAYAKNPARALSIFEEMKRFNVPMEMQTYKFLFNALASTPGNVQKAYELLLEMDQNKVDITEDIAASVISVLRKQERIEYEMLKKIRCMLPEMYRVKLHLTTIHGNNKFVKEKGFQPVFTIIGAPAEWKDMVADDRMDLQDEFVKKQKMRDWDALDVEEFDQDLQDYLDNNRQIEIYSDLEFLMTEDESDSADEIPDYLVEYPAGDDDVAFLEGYSSPDEDRYGHIKQKYVNVNSDIEEEEEEIENEEVNEEADSGKDEAADLYNETSDSNKRIDEILDYSHNTFDQESENDSDEVKFISEDEDDEEEVFDRLVEQEQEEEEKEEEKE